MMMMMGSLKQVLIFGVGLVVALGLYHLINTKNTTTPSHSYLPPQQSHNTNHNSTANQPDDNDDDDDDDKLISAVNQRPNFDYFLFALQWPAAFCNIQRSKQTRCNPDHPLQQHQTKFTVHGLWPQLNGAESPLFCTPAPQMTYNDLLAVQNKLLDYWPNLYDAQKWPPGRRNFWTKQWNKHGTCSSNKFNTTQYLDITIKLAENHAKRIFDGLDKRGIIPNGILAFKEEDIKKAVKEITGTNPMLKMQLNYLGEHLLLEIHLCVLDDGVTLFDCECDPRYRFAAP